MCKNLAYWRWYLFSTFALVSIKVAQQSVHPTLGILARFQAFFYAPAFSQSDGVPPPAPARVTQTVGRFRGAKQSRFSRFGNAIKDIMEKKSFLYFLNNSEYYALLVGLGVACIHFVITYFGLGSIGGYMQNWCYQALFGAEGADVRCGMIMGFIFLAPSYILLMYADLELGSHVIPLILISSFFYGSLASFLISKNTSLRVIGAVLIIFLLCITGFGLMTVLFYVDA